MTSGKLIFGLGVLIAITGMGCESSVVGTAPTASSLSLTPTPSPSRSASPTPSTPPSPGLASNNVMQITVNGSLCSASTSANYINKPCASVTICQPGTTNCQTVNDILVDTGSYGLRVFPSGTNADGSSYNLSSLNLSTVTQSGLPVADCAQFMDGSALWGSVVHADVVLVSGGERASSVPIQLIDSSYAGSTPSGCDGGVAAATPVDAGFNGIIGLGLWEQDCGTYCDPAYNTSVSASVEAGDYYPYYTCSGNTCSQALVSVANQVANPASAFPVNNNGLIFELPAISSNGVDSVSGSIVFGIGTNGNTNNVLSPSATVYHADSAADFATIFNGTTYSDSSSNSNIMGSFIDSGSNSLYFTPPSTLMCCESDSNGDLTDTLVACSSASSSGWICSSGTVSATNESVGFNTRAPTGSGTSVSLRIADFYTLGDASTMVFSNVASADESCSSDSPCTFDFGLPFFFGRNVYVGFQKMSGETMVTQPYWAY